VIQLVAVGTQLYVIGFHEFPLVSVS
jgi:hypothetical protein